MTTLTIVNEGKKDYLIHSNEEGAYEIEIRPRVVFIYIYTYITSEDILRVPLGHTLAVHSLNLFS